MSFETKQMAMRYFEQLTRGCGRSNCPNVDCANNKGCPKRKPKEALQHSLVLMKRGAPLCRKLQNKYIPSAYKGAKPNPKPAAAVDNGGAGSGASGDASEEKEASTSSRRRRRPASSKPNLSSASSSTSSSSSRPSSGRASPQPRARSQLTVVEISLDENPDRKFTLPFSETNTSWEEFLWATLRKFVDSPPAPDAGIETLVAHVRIWKVFDNGDSVELDLLGDPREADIENKDTLVVSIDADALERLSGGDEFDDESGVDLNETVEDLKSRLNLSDASSQWIDIFQRQSGQKKKSAYSKRDIRAALEGPFHLVEFSPKRSLIENDKGHRLLLETSAFFQTRESFPAEFEIPQTRIWVFILCLGGKFAGAVYQGGKCVAHKTFSRYVIRKKQGGRQSTKDRSSGNTIKSAGSYMRRYHEARLTEEVQQLLLSWKAHIDAAYSIYVYAPGLPNKSLIFATSSSADTNSRTSAGLLDKNDSRLRGMPTRTSRVTLLEIQAVEKHVTHVEWFPPEDTAVKKQ